MLPVNTLHPVRKPAYVTYGLLALNALVFFWELTQTRSQLNAAFFDYAAVMCQVARSPISPETTLDILRSMFFHGSWTHLVGNMTFLWIFGRNVEAYFGHARFLVLYLVWGFIAAFAETVINSGLCVPMIGASGAIAGVLGSYLILYAWHASPRSDHFLPLFPAFLQYSGFAGAGLLVHHPIIQRSPLAWRGYTGWRRGLLRAYRWLCRRASAGFCVYHV